jgi:rubredoxin
MMRKWYCMTCDFVFDEALGLPEFGIEPGTNFEGLPDDWLCPECGSPKDYFELRGEE